MWTVHVCARLSDLFSNQNQELTSSVLQFVRLKLSSLLSLKNNNNKWWNTSTYALREYILVACDSKKRGEEKKKQEMTNETPHKSQWPYIEGGEM